MASLTQTEANNILNGALLTGTSFTPPTSPLKLALVTANGSATSAGTESTGGSYARQTLAMAAASAGQSANSSAINFTNMPASTVVGAEIWDSAGSPIRKWWNALTASKTLNAGDTLSFAAGAITVAAA